MVPREIGRYITTASMAFLSSTWSWSSVNVAEGRRKSHHRTGSNSDCDSYIDPTLSDYIQCDLESHRDTFGPVI
jgi:hypothetical protein